MPGGIKMTRRITRLSQIALFAALPALLVSGCHLVLGPEDGEQEWWYYCNEVACYRCNADYCERDDGRCWTDGDCPSSMSCNTSTGSCYHPVKPPCKTSKECGSDYICISGTCVPDRVPPGPCTKDADCGDGAYCQNGSCKDTGVCKQDADCSKFGNSICDSRGTCIPGPPIQSCTDGASCSGGLCVDAKCGSCAGDCGGGKTCEFNAHCGKDRVCLDGKCTNSCAKDTDCGGGQVCKSKVCVNATGTCAKNADCGSGKLCVNKTCYFDCTSGGTCSSSSDVCSPGVTSGDLTVKWCYADTSANLECKVNKDCTGGELCVNGVCRTSCTQAADCAACEDGPVCGTGGFCMTSSEANPKCNLNKDCTSGKACLNAQCVTL
jgi:hypothetical protein